MADWLKAEKADAAVLAALDSIAWTFNVRGQDVEHTPVALSFALVRDDGTADLFVASEKIGDDVRQHLGNGVRVHERADFEPALAAFAGKTVAVDPERSVAAIFEALENAGAHVISKRDPSILPKAIKNQVEISGHRAAQARDGAALSRFLHWLSVEAPKGGVDELSAAAKLQAFRQAGGDLRDLSFDTISGAGPNGAIVHYRVSEETNRPLEMDSIYLVDSGGQYPDGTTDVTRTVAIGTPTAEMKDRFTRVLQGHIAVARARFPEGTRGSQLDSFARQYLWSAGLDYAHGTGHGVGSFLAVHEGPQRISPVGSAQPGGDEPLEGRHDHFQRARLLQDRRIWHPRRESRPGRAGRGRRRREEAARLRDAHLRADRPQPDRDGDAEPGGARLGRRLSRRGAAGSSGPQLEGEAEGLARGAMRAAMSKASSRT